MSEAPTQAAPASPEVLGKAMSQLLQGPSATSLLDLPTHIISSIVDILLIQGRSPWPHSVDGDYIYAGGIGGHNFDDIASLRLTCSMFDNLVLARATQIMLLGHVNEVSVFSSLPVRLLQTMTNLKLIDLKQCKGTPLSLVGLPTTITAVNLGGPKLSRKLRCNLDLDLSPLSKCIGLIDLDISSCNGVADLSPLAECKYLDKLNISDCIALTFLSPLAHCTNLSVLNLRCSNITDLCPLSACKELEMIDCSDTKVSDLSPLSVCLKLRDVECSGTMVSDISPLSACLNLMRVNCIDTAVRDITSLAACPQLRKILCEEDVSGVEWEARPGEYMHHKVYGVLVRLMHPAFPEVKICVPSQAIPIF
eukprot:gene3145-biopygen20902